MNTELHGDIEQNFTKKKSILAIILGFASLVLSQAISNLTYLLPLPNLLSTIIFSLFYIILSYNLIRLCCTKILHISMTDCFIIIPNISIIWFIISILLPITVSIVLLFNNGELITNSINTFQKINIIVYAIFKAGLSAGIVEEMIFRGMIMKSLDKCFGKIIAIIVPSFIFGLMHTIGLKADITSTLLLIVTGTIVGIMFSLIVYESGSIWCSAIVHGIWNIIMIGGILTISTSYHNNAIYSYKLSSKSIILTGGAFGVESSIVSILGYIIVIAVTLFLMKKKVKES